MAILRIVEVVVTLTFIVFMITQVIAPLWWGTRCFPFFSQERREALDLVTEAREKLETARIYNEAQEVANEIKHVVDDEESDDVEEEPKPRKRRRSG